MKLTEITWDAKWELGVTKVDEQHKRLIAIVNDLALSTTPKLVKLFASLIEYAGDHFLDEEEIMISIDFPGTADHKMEHRLFNKALLEYSFRVNNGEDKEKLKEEVIDFVTKWFVYHFLKTDRKLVDYIKGGGAIAELNTRLDND